MRRYTHLIDHHTVGHVHNLTLLREPPSTTPTLTTFWPPSRWRKLNFRTAIHDEARGLKQSFKDFLVWKMNVDSPSFLYETLYETHGAWRATEAQLIWALSGLRRRRPRPQKGVRRARSQPEPQRGRGCNSVGSILGVSLFEIEVGFYLIQYCRLASLNFRRNSLRSLNCFTNISWKTWAKQVFLIFKGT